MNTINKRKKKKDKKDDNLIFWIRATYVIFIFIWLMIVFYFELYDIGPLAWIIVFIPIIIFITGYREAPFTTFEDENNVFQASFLAIGLLVVVPLINWMRENFLGDCKKFVTLILFGIVLTLFSVLDI